MSLSVHQLSAIRFPSGEILNMHLADATGQSIDQIAKETPRELVR